MTMSRTVVRFAACALSVSSLLAVGCRRFRNLYGRDAEITMGQDFAKEFERDPKSPKALHSGPHHQRLQRVAARILPLAKTDWDVPYSVTLLDTDEVNAFAVPGGPIYFNRGLMELVESDDEVAAVLGHEATHIVKRHSAKQMSDSAVKGALAEVLLSRSGKTAQALARIGLEVKSLEFSRGDESESDTIGFGYLVRAGYSPEAMASFFRKLQKKAGDGSRKTAFLNSHPLTSARIAAAERLASEYRATVRSAP